MDGNSSAGFTLIELLVVIVIIGILVGLAIPNMLSAQKRANDTAAMSCANALAKAVQIYRIDHPRSFETPSVSDLYGNEEKDEFYGTNTCSKMGANGEIFGEAALDGQYTFTVKHLIGRKKFSVTPSGIKSI